MRVITTGKHQGKTTALIGWVAAGKPMQGYPGWTRILLVHDRNEHNRLRRRYWWCIDDFEHRIYTLTDWCNARNVSRGVAIAIDNLDLHLHLRTSGNGFVDLVSITGLPRAPEDVE